MLQLKSFVFNLFGENTFILYDETKECVIVDPGCMEKQEQDSLVAFIENNNLKPVRLINTHCHVDHILGNKFISEKYSLKPQIHKEELIILTSTNSYSTIFGLPSPNSPLPDKYLTDNEIVSFGNSHLKVLFVPGHSPGHINLYSEEQKFLICGDVLFLGSIGRTDLPGGDHNQLIHSIQKQLMVLPEDTVVYSGHGPTTKIGYEKRHNPFLN